MSERSEQYKKAMEEGKIIGVILYACNTASKEYYSQGELITDKKPIAKKYSEAFQNIVVVAADGFVYYGDNFLSDSKIEGVFNHNRDGGYVTFYKGKELSKSRSTYTPNDVL
uniref:hypothetical protein n=1 Tax=Dysgonomonas gadei TaxID=156974 RepID=UPI003AEFE263